MLENDLLEMGYRSVEEILGKKNPFPVQDIPYLILDLIPHMAKGRVSRFSVIPYIENPASEELRSNMYNVYVLFR